MSGLAALSIGAKLTGAKAALAKVPPKVWYALAVAALLVSGVIYHHYRVRKHDAAVVLAEDTRINTMALKLKAKVDALTARISTDERNRNDEQNRIIAAGAGALRLHGPGKAVCPGRIGAASAASGSVAPGGTSDVAGPQVPSDNLAAVPWGWLTDSAEQADLNRAEVLSWRSWYAKLVATWPK